MSNFYSRKNFSRHSLPSSMHVVNERVARRQESQMTSNEIRARDDYNRSLSDYSRTLFQPCWDLQRTSGNLVFFNRLRGEVIQFPYPAYERSRDELVRIIPKGFKNYFDNKRLRFECFCGLTSVKPKYVDVRGDSVNHFMDCAKCGLSICLEDVYRTASFEAIYDSEDPDGGIHPVTLSSRRVANHKIRRSQRRVSAPPYIGYRKRGNTADSLFSRGSSPISDWELRMEFGTVDQPIIGKRKRHNSLFSDNCTGPSSQPDAKKIKCEDSPSIELFTTSSPSARPSSSRPDIFQFCSYCDVGMDALDIPEHERECATTW